MLSFTTIYSSAQAEESELCTAQWERDVTGMQLFGPLEDKNRLTHCKMHIFIGYKSEYAYNMILLSIFVEERKEKKYFSPNFVPFLRSVLNYKGHSFRSVVPFFAVKLNFVPFCRSVPHKKPSLTTNFRSRSVNEGIPTCRPFGIRTTPKILTS